MDSLEQAREALKDCITLIEGWSHRWDGQGNHPQTVIENARETVASLSIATPVDGVGAEPVRLTDTALEWAYDSPSFFAVASLPTGEKLPVESLREQSRVETVYKSALASPEAEARLRERVVEGTRTFALSAMVSKSIPGGRTQSSMVGYRRCNTEDEARGSFIRSVEKEKPDFSIDQLLCIEIPAEARLAQAERGPVVTEAMVEAALNAAPHPGSDVTVSEILASAGAGTHTMRAALEAALHPQSAAGEEGKP